MVRLNMMANILSRVSVQVAYNGKAEPQRRVGETATPDKYTNKTKRPRYNEQR
jgi:hypothetical protein